MDYKTSERQRAASRRHAKKHREYYSQKRKIYYQSHIEQERAQDKLYYAKHREALKQRARDNYQKNKVELAERAREYRKQSKYEVLAHYSISGIPKCCRCGIEDLDVLCIDHIDGSGDAHRRQIKRSSGSEFYKWLKVNNYPIGFQVLCANCNLKKKIRGI